jgi:hypothetical protein
MNTEIAEAPTEVAPPEPKPVVETTPKPSTETVSQDRSKSRDPNKARSILRGEIPKEETKPEGERGSESEDDAEVIARMFDPETGEFIEEGDAEEEPAAGKAAEKPKAETKAAKAEVADEAETEQSESEEQEEDKPGPKKRISITNKRLGDRDFAIVQLADREHISLDDARGRLFGDEPAAKREAAEETPAPRETPDQIQAKINGLTEQRKAAAKSLDVEKATELSDQISDLKEQMRAAQWAVQNEAQARQTGFQTAVMASATKAIELYPDSAVEGSELFEAIDAARLDRIETDPAFFQTKNWPVALASEIAAGLGVAPALKTSAAETKAAAENKPAPQAATLPKKSARPAPPNPAPGTATGAAQINQEDALRTELKAAKKNNDADAVKAVMRKIDAFNAKPKR